MIDRHTRRVAGTVSLAFALSLALGTPAMAEPLILSVENAAGTDIVGLFVGDADGIEDEAENLLGEEPLAPGQIIEIDLADDDSECDWTVGLVYDADDLVTMEVVDVCQTPLHLATGEAPEPLILSVENAAGIDIVALYVAGADGIDSGVENLLGDEPLAPGQIIEIDLADDDSECSWTVGVVYDADDLITAEVVDVCQTPLYLVTGESSQPAAEDMAGASATESAAAESGGAPAADCDPMMAGQAAGEAVYETFGGDAESPEAKPFWDRLTFAVPLLATGQAEVACAIYADLVSAIKEKRPLAAPESLGYVATSQPLAAQPPTEFSQYQVRINLANAEVSLTVNGVPVGTVRSDTNLSMVAPLIGWLANGPNSLGIIANGLGAEARASVVVARMGADGTSEEIGGVEWSADAPSGTIAMEGSGLPDWAWTRAEARMGEDAAVEAAATTFLAAAAAGDRARFDAVFEPVRADLVLFYGEGMVKQGTEQMGGAFQGAGRQAPSLSVEADGDGRFYRVRRADGGNLIGMPDDGSSLSVMPGDTWAFVDGEWRMVGLGN